VMLQVEKQTNLCMLRDRVMSHDFMMIFIPQKRVDTLGDR
jgi:hypothetical protein